METTLIAVALLALSAALAGVGLAGLTGRLPRNHLIGLRNRTLRADDAAWRAGHAAAGRALLAAAGAPLLLAAVLLVSPPEAVGDWLPACALVGLLTGGLIALAVRQADTAVARLQAENGETHEDTP
jgi:hypothetical protein